MDSLKQLKWVRDSSSGEVYCLPSSSRCIITYVLMYVSGTDPDMQDELLSDLISGQDTNTLQSVNEREIFISFGFYPNKTELKWK